ncbi:tape measure protein [Limosilactobacillus mucosae]|uniref:tape measure protein n=1 Tax=Limosilactobacillus mucosae TaxID=97478 RepID=UPI0025A434E5|nr:tape measure protein [Limosilactobacillus mucosae]MDM8220045.1 tape measure protein [Limosilactobacillus mucosae]MDM8314701.1 tape measure protein [Limosilactobacillus mucosae]
MAESMSIEAVLSAVDQNFTKTMEQAVQSLGEVIDKSKQTAPAGSAGAGGIKQLASSLGLVAIGAKAFNVLSDSIGGAIDRFDTLNKYPVVMDALGYSARDVAKSSKLMQKGIDGLPTSLQDITSVAQQLAPLTGSATKASKSALALNNAFLASGASVADTSRGLQQYTQMLSTGKVDMMSYRTLMETMPIALRKVANAFGFTGKSAEQDLYNALQSGQISVDQLNDKFIELNKGQNGFAQLAKKNSAGIATSFANLKASVVKNLGNMLTAINNGFSKAGFGSIAQVLDNMKVGINGAFKAITPIVTQATTGGLNTLKALFDFVNANKNWLVPLVVGIGSGLLGFKALTSAINGAKTAWKVAKDVFAVGNVLTSMATGSKAAGSALTFMADQSKAAAGALKMISAVGANPYVAIIAGIVAVVAALAWWFTQTESGKNAWKSLCDTAINAWNSFYPLIKPAIDVIVGAWNNFVQAVQTAWQAMQPAFESIKQAFLNLMQALQPLMPVIQQVASIIGAVLVGAIVAVVYAVAVLVAGISTIITGLMPLIQAAIGVIQAALSAIMYLIGAIVSGFAGSLSGLIQIAQSIWDGVVAVFQGGWQVLKGVFDVFIGIITGDWTQAWNGIKEIFSGIWTALSGVAKAGWGSIKGIFNAGVGFIKGVMHFSLSAEGEAIMNSLLGGLKKAWESVKSFVSGITKWFPKHKGPISVDRRLLIPAGQAIMNGLNNGLIDGFGDVQSNVSGMADQIQKAIADPGFDIGANISNLGSVNSNYSGNLAIQDSQLQIQNNALLRRLVNKDTTMVLDDGTLVGYTAAQYDQRLGQNTALKDRWSR